MTAYRVLIADDNAAFRCGVQLALEGHGFTVCGQAATGLEALQLALEYRPDLCVLDVQLRGGGIAAARAITSRLPGTVVVMLTFSHDDDDLFDALSAGASGYLMKDMDPERLPLALEGVLRGEAALPRTLVARLVDAYHPRTRRRRRLPVPGRRAPELTPREYEVLELLREGLGTAEIAERLVVEPVTVRTHVAAVLRKLDVDDRASALKLIEESEFAADGR